MTSTQILRFPVWRCAAGLMRILGHRAVCCIFACALLLGGSAISDARAAVIIFQAIDLNDGQGPGGDLWSYSFTPSEYVFNENFGFSIAFDPALYGALQDPPPFVNADWDVITLQPDTALPDDALALTDNASLANPFTLSFVWLGAAGTAPGAQPFTINEFDAGGSFVRTVESGFTQTVPEPGAAALVAAGLAMLLGGRRARRTRPPAPDLRKRLTLFRSSILVATCLALATAGKAAPAIGNYEVVSTARIGRTEFEYTIRAKATNAGPAVTGVSGVVTSTSANTTIVQNSLQFGDIAAGAMKTSTDTFKIRQDRRFPFNPNSLQWQVSTLDVPESWAGEWKITTTYKDGATAEVVAEDMVTTVFFAGETFGLSFMQGACTGTVTDTSAQVTLNAQLTEGTCVQTGHLVLAVNRTGDTLSGSGNWSLTVQGNCPNAVNGAQTFTVTGVRLNTAQGGFDQSHPTLLQRVLANRVVSLFSQ